MKKVISLSLTALMIISLAACGNKNNPSDASGNGSGSEPNTSASTSIPPAAIENQAEEFTKKLVPLTFEPGETSDGSLYYRSVSEDGGIFYEIQPEGEETTMKVPVAESIIYVVEKAEDCKVVKVNFDYVVEGGETEHIVQYRIFSQPDTGIVVNGENNPVTAEPEVSIEADTSAEAPVDAATEPVEGDLAQAEAPDASQMAR